MSNASGPAKTPPNLWVEAYERLPNELRTSLKAASDPGVDVLEAVLQAAQKRLHEMNDGRWKFKRPGGGAFIVRDAMEKVIKWIDRFKAVGDTVVQYDPTHAALPWAAVRFLLQVAVNDFEIYGALVENIDFICRLIRRHAISEAIYARYSTSASLALRETLILLYSKVLSYLANAIRYMDPKGHVIRSTFKSPKSFEIQGIVSSDTEVDKCFRLVLAEVAIASTDDFIKITRVWENLEAPIVEIAQRDAAVQREAKENEWQDFLKWLSPLDFHDQHRQIRDRRLDESATWILDHEEVIEWKNSQKSSVLLIHGIPGSGKSMLASKLIDWLGDQSTLPGNAKVAYFYCKRSAAEPERQCPGHILGSVLRQLVSGTSSAQSQFQESLLQEFKQRREKAAKDGFRLRSLQPKESIEIVQGATKTNAIFLIIDALDEVEESQRLELVECLVSLARNSQEAVKIIVTSRHDTQIINLLSEARKVSICPGDNEKDVSLFIRHSIEERKRLKMGVLGGNPSREFEDELYDYLKRRTDEMFLWAALQLERLSLIESEEDALETLESLPRDLNETYEEIMGRVAVSGPTTSRIVASTFQWMLHAKETLSLDTLLCALASRESKWPNHLDGSSLVRICRNLIIVDEESNKVRFAHSTIQEFLLSKPDFAPIRSHESIAAASLWMLTTDDLIHFRSAAPGLVTPLQDQLRNFVFDEKKEPSLQFEFWLKDAQILSEELERDSLLRKYYYGTDSTSRTPLFMICIFGLHGLLAELEVQDFSWDQPNTKCHTGLYLAASLGNSRIVEFLIGKKANVNVGCGRYGNPLHAACYYGHVDVVSKLLDHGACAKRAGPMFDNALDAAIRGGHESVAKILVEQEIFSLDQAGIEAVMTTLGHAGFVKAVKELQKLNNTQQQRSQLRQHVEKAIELGRIQQLRRLLRGHSDPKDLFPADALALAALNGDLGMIDFCLDHGLDIEARGRYGRPLRAASLQGHRAAVEKLLNHGAKASDGDALEAATMKGHFPVVEALLKHPSVVLTPSRLHFGSAVRSACSHGRLDILGHLVTAGADLEQVELEMGIMEIASKAGHERIVQFLVAAGLESAPEPLDPFWGT
ncbi:hypothetical protein CkaCkLH20_03783 [Colletotrichum karsti]|uniref:NACHT domain-containing protein n=1 Tax=Colletotrichum karsti TaxID=1095194 RepID=A0A9P6I9M7_9PEZI|nr:uncharacterized protein CkaCkLH20_03783 [Colletotrichum karsti]KAF9878883.1 hypothetical protein CkaCkLH20_03783 [Colletotrichum karsti]